MSGGGHRGGRRQESARREGARRRAGSLIFAALLLSTFAPRLASAGDKRPLPDYDGRGGEPTTAGDVLIWIPRIILAPLYLVSEYVIRWPLGLAIGGAERAGLPQTIYDIFAFGPDHKVGIVPTGYVDFGFRPSVGSTRFGTTRSRGGTICGFNSGRGGKIGFRDRSPIASATPATLTTASISTSRRSIDLTSRSSD